MSERFKPGDRVLVPGTVDKVASVGVTVRLPDLRETLTLVSAEDLRPDTGRPITAADVRDAVIAFPIRNDVRWESVADCLTNIARGAPERGDDKPRSGNGGNAGACPACAGGEPHEPWTDEDAENVETALRAADADRAGHWPTVAGWLACEVRRLRAGSPPAMPPKVTEALGWFHSAPEDTNSFLAWLHARYMTDEWGAQKHAATVVRWALSLPGTGERAASEQVDADEVLRSVIRELTHQRDNNYEDSGNFREAFDASIDFVQRALADSSPRSWSLPAPPPDDVTVVHVPAAPNHLLYRADGSGTVWESKRLGKFFRWSQMLGEGTVVEGEPQAAEPPDPEKDDAIAHMRMQDAIERRLRDHGAGYEDEPWFADVIDGAAAAALAAAGAERVEEES